MVVNRFKTMGARGGGGGRGGRGGGRRAARTDNLMRFNDAKYGAVSIRKNKTAQQVLAQANRLEKALIAQTQSMAAGAKDLVEAAKIVQPKMNSLRKIKAAQRLAKIVKGTKV